MTITCSGAATAPTAANITATVAAGSSGNTLPLSITGTATTVAVTLTPSHGTATVSGTSILYTPTAGYSGPDSLSYTASNSGGTSSAATASITVTPPPPTVANTSTTVATGSSSNALTLSITGTASSVAVASGPAHGTVTISGNSILYTPTAGYSGSDSLTYTASNSGGTAAAATASITVTAAAPTAANITASVAANSSGNALPLSITGTATAVAVTSGPAHGSVTISGTSVLYTPTAGYSGSDSLSYTASNSGGTSSAATASITVTPPPPTVANTSTTVATGSSNGALTLSITGTASAVAVASGPAHGTATISGNSILYTPTAGYSGPDSLTYTATNSGGTSSPATASITVSAAAPTVASITASVAANSSGNTLPLSISGAATTVAVTSGPAHGSVTISGTSILYSPTAGYSGTDSLSYTASNAGGTSSAATATITVTPAAPTVANITASVAGNSSNNALPLAITGSASSVAVTAVPAHGTVTISGNSIRYTPTAGYTGADILSYTATNGGGTSSAATASITVTAAVATVAAPKVANVAASVSADSSSSTLTLSISGKVSSVTVTSAPSHGSARVSGSRILYTPFAGYSGTDSLSYTATNSGGTSEVATVSITVTAVPPVVENISATLDADSSSNTLTLSIAGAVSSVAVTSPPSHGTASVSGTSILYTPVAGFTGTDSLSYTATNSGGTSRTATASIHVTAVPLSLSPGAGALTVGTAAKAYSQHFAAAGGARPYTYAASTLPAGLSLSAQGELAGTPTTAGSYSFTVTAIDAASSTFSATYTLAIAPPAAESLPMAVDRSVTVNAGQSIVVNLSTGATSAAATSASLLTKPDAAQGSASISNNFYLTFAATAQASGTLALKYTLNNQFGASNTATLTVQIIARPDPSQDQQVIGLVNAQAQSAVQFASAQISNFNNRLEHLHNEADRQSRLFNVSIGAPQHSRNNDVPADVASRQNALGAAPGAEPVSTAKAAQRERESDHSALAIWTGGYVNFVNSDRDRLRLDHTTVGISAGADYRFSPTLVAGIGVGIGHDVADVANAGTQSKDNAASTALYASYHPGPLYVDSLLGYSHLNFDSRRYVTTTDGYADGSRSGQQAFGAISSGYEFQLQSLMLAPYGRMQFSSTSLRHYTESGAGIYNLAYANQRVNTLAAVLGVRSQYGVPTSWGALRLTSRVEYSDAVRRDSVARLGFADLADDTYSVNVLSLDQNKLSIAAGVEFMLHSGWALGLSYQGAHSTDGGTRENALLFRAGWKY